MIPLSSFSQNVKNWIVLLPGDGNLVSIESLKEYSLPRAEHRLEMLRQQLAANAQNWGAVEKITRKIDACDAALSELHRLIYPSLVGSVYGGPAEQHEVSGTAELGLVPCRFPSCPELASREDRYLRGGACRKCFQKLLDQHPADTSEERIDHA